MYRESKQLEPEVTAVDLDAIDLERTQYRLAQMVRRETRGFGDDNAALERLSEDYDLPFWTVHRIVKGKAKTVTGGIIRRVQWAYVRYCEKQIRLLQDELERHKVVAPDDNVSDLVGKAESLAAEVAAMRKALNEEG